MIRVLVVTPVRLYRDGIVDALARDGRLDVVGAAASGEEGLALVGQLGPDALVLDVGTAGPPLVRQIVARTPAPRVIALAVRENPADIVEWAEVGVAGFVTAEGTVTDLVAAVVGASHDELVCSPLVAAVLLRRVRALAAEPTADVRLTDREIEIAQLIERGLMNKEIASRLGIELATVKNHVHRILEKLGADRRTEAAAHIRRSGLALED